MVVWFLEQFFHFFFVELCNAQSVNIRAFAHSIIVLKNTAHFEEISFGKITFYKFYTNTIKIYIMYKSNVEYFVATKFNTLQEMRFFKAEKAFNSHDFSCSTITRYKNIAFDV